MVCMILETERLILDTWESADWTEFRALATDPEIMRYITGGDPWTDEKIRSFVDSQIEAYRNPRVLSLEAAVETGRALYRFLRRQLLA